MANQNQTVVFLSRHHADKAMMDQLREKLGEFEFIQYGGTFSCFSGNRDQKVISFEEVIKGEDGETTTRREIPGDSVIIAVAPPQVQIAILNAIRFAGGEAKLLQPLMNRITDQDGNATFEYVGLNHVSKVEIVSTPFCGGELAPAHERR